MSTRGVTLEQEGFIHCSTRDQVEATANRFYGDVEQLVVLTIDPRSRAVTDPVRATGARAAPTCSPTSTDRCRSPPCVDATFWIRADDGWSLD